MSLKIIEPISITNAMLLSTNVPENDYAEWSTSTTYTFGARVIYTSNHKIYESLQSGNLNKAPTTQTTWWAEVKPTNRWAAFDTSNSTKTFAPASDSPKITYELSVSSIDSVALLNIDGTTEAKITLTHPVSGIVFSETVSLLGSPKSSEWWAWFFGDRDRPSQVVITDIPKFVNSKLTIELTGNQSMSIGVIIVGTTRQIGNGVLNGARVGIQDYSRKEKNSYGDTVLVERAFARRANFDILIEAIEVDMVISYLSSIRAKPCLWIGGTSEALSVYGFYKSFEVLIKYATHSEFQLELEGLT